MAQPQPDMRSLPEPPTDGITALSYMGDDQSRLLASSSWDGSVRIYDTSSLTNVCTQVMESGPLLGMATAASDSKILFTGGLDGSGEFCFLLYTFWCTRLVIWARALRAALFPYMN